MTAASQFDRATAVAPRVAEPSTFDVTIDEQWTIGPSIPNGGYLLAILGRAAVAAGGAHPHVVAASVQYVAPPTIGPATAVTEVLRAGRSATQIRATLVQDGVACTEALFTVSTLDPSAPVFFGAMPPVALPPEEQCVPLPPPPDMAVNLRAVVDSRFDPTVLTFLDGPLPPPEEAGGELRGWFRFADGRDHDPLSLLFVVDAFPPATFTVVRTGWVPTLSLSAYIRAVPAPGPLRIRFRAGMIADGLVDEVCEVWDAGDRLVAQATQLAGIRVAPAP